mgnify:CR=1 FL=1
MYRIIARIGGYEVLSEAFLTTKLRKNEIYTFHLKHWMNARCRFGLRSVRFSFPFHIGKFG